MCNRTVYYGFIQVPIMDQEKKAKLEKLKKLQKISQQHSNHAQVHPNSNSQIQSHHKSPSVGNQSKVKREPKMPLTGQKRKTEKKKEIVSQKSNNDFTKMAKKKPKMIKGNAQYLLTHLYEVIINIGTSKGLYPIE